MSFKNTNSKKYELECNKISRQLQKLYVEYFVVVCDICNAKIRQVTLKEAKTKMSFHHPHMCDRCLKLAKKSGMIEGD